MLKVDIVTIFPDLVRAAFGHSIVARAVRDGLVRIDVHDLRAWSEDAHASVDDAPFGGGGGMVMTAPPLFRAVGSITGRAAGERSPGEAVVLLTPAGERHDQARARRYAGLERLVLICGRYEGVDERVRSELCTEAVSIGDYVLSGGEPAAAVVVDSVVRLLPGALGNPTGAETESHEDGLLEAPHYTRPADFRGLAVPPVLLSGHHGRIDRWRRRQSVLTTARVRPDLIQDARRRGLLTAEDERVLDELGGREADALAGAVAPSRHEETQGNPEAGASGLHERNES